MTPLAERIKALIAASGPIGVADYFAMCLGDPAFGYYRRREPFGRAGDFTTAPEISQLFGEMVGIFVVEAWTVHGRPDTPALVELGPGRGTMMADMLRTIDRLAPELGAQLRVHMVETSERLAAVQRTRLGADAGRVAWHESWEAVPHGFTMVIANEFFDAIPIRQYVATADGFRERVVGLDAAGELAFHVGPGRIGAADVPETAREAPPGAILEMAPAREAIVAGLAERLAADGGLALVVDYGHLVSGTGDTLQALKDHAFDPPLAHPGEADLTSHVDFAALAGAARGGGAHVVGAMTQGDFLVGLGLLERAGLLGAGKDAATQEAIRDAVERLAAPGHGNMGELFKVLAIAAMPVPLPPFRHAD